MYPRKDERDRQPQRQTDIGTDRQTDTGTDRDRGTDTLKGHLHTVLLTDKA